VGSVGRGYSSPAIGHASLSDLHSDGVVVVPYYEGDGLENAGELNPLRDARLSASLSREEIKPKLYSMTLLHAIDDRPAVLVVGAGERHEADALLAMRVAAAATSHVVGRGFSSVAFLDRGVLDPYDFGRASLEGAVRGAYDPALFKTRSDSDRRLDRVYLVSDASHSPLDAGAGRGTVVGSAVNLARDLINLPPNELSPTALGERTQGLADECGLQCELLGREAMAELGMGAILGVSAGSTEPPRVIILKHGNPDSPVRLALAGKGITFDSGGLSLKTGEGMMTMKGDMGGAAAVIASVVAIARLGVAPDISIAGYVGATENMPGGSAMRPGDVLRAVNGETIEVLNTDAEGRLVLADLLAFATQQGATHLVDVATLTGGAAVALGSGAMLAAGKPMDWVNEVVAGATRGLERAWAMPIYEEYRRAMDSEIADVKNTGGREASALTASAFLSDFVGDTPWAHLDIAGTSWAHTALPYQPRGGTGAGVGTLVSVAYHMSERYG
jgi:leucyl aminopeptidase